MLTKKLNIIGIYGHAGVGKDTVAGYLYSKYERTYGEAFALALKRAASKAFGIQELWFHDRDIKELIHPVWKVSPRQIAQFMGTEMFRNMIPQLIPGTDSDFWIRRLEGKLEGTLLLEEDGEYEDGDTVIITDVRFQNEVDWIQQNGGCILELRREGCNGAVGIANHISETKFNITQAWLIANNHSLEVLYEEVDKFITWTEFKLERKHTEAEIENIVNNL